jgi:hypothetical protein
MFIFAGFCSCDYKQVRHGKECCCEMNQLQHTAPNSALSRALPRQHPTRAGSCARA